MNDLIWFSATALARAIREKELSSEEVVRAHLDRIEEVNPKLNAVVQLAADRALAEAQTADDALARGDLKGPLHGVPITLKDSIDTEGIITTGGTLGRKSFVPERDATVAARLRNAGAVLLGKTNTPELTMAAGTDNLIYGRTNNPYNLSRSPGGSSGGAGAIIASGGSPLDLGSDTGGSIRMPTHFCGIAGVKPTSGRVPRSGHIIPWGLGAVDAFTQIGPMARFVEDLILTLPIISGVDWEDPAIVPMPLGEPDAVELRQLRVAFYVDNGEVTPTSETVQAVQAAAEALSNSGASVQEDRLPALARSGELRTKLSGADGRSGTRRLLARAGTTKPHPWIQDRLNEADPLEVGEYTALLEEIDLVRSEMLSFMQDYDSILCPVSPYAALPHESWRDEDLYPGVASYTAPYNFAGWPSAVVRAGTSPEGLPIGVQAVARPWREDVSLAVARHLESELGGWQRPEL